MTPMHTKYAIHINRVKRLCPPSRLGPNPPNSAAIRTTHRPTALFLEATLNAYEQCNVYGGGEKAVRRLHPPPALGVSGSLPDSRLLSFVLSALRSTFSTCDFEPGSFKIRMHCFGLTTLDETHK